jgi:hypothetical protein
MEHLRVLLNLLLLLMLHLHGGSLAGTGKWQLVRWVLNDVGWELLHLLLGALS